MPEGYWKPEVKYPDSELQSMPSATGLLKEAQSEPTVSLPEIGAKMLLVVRRYGGVELLNERSEIQQPRNGEQIVEVQVTALKTMRIVVE